MIPPGRGGAFVADMDHVLSVYAEPYNPLRPVVSFDERPCVLHGDTRDPLPMRPGADARQDHEYVRGGTCCAMLAFEPLTARRRIWVLPRRRRVEFAEVVRQLCDEVYPEAERVRLVCDQLNTHGTAAFYEAFAPAEARRLAQKVEFVHTPVHGSWLNVVECEFSALVRQCLGHRRLGTVEALRREAEAWLERPRRGSRGRGVGREAQRRWGDGRLAVHDRGRAGEAAAALPVTMTLSED